ncbi:hypothetical protein NUW54_g12415 [Trametes sanguinea]|uniref:Uncharacterized protein n=1 Tax=Trametes sanguinea TaxID=158606 RepID=A0ACC1MZ28_9APHY|nr:hypothetical protein NUW54_g12415 [Trametes sanguinea]
MSLCSHCVSGVRHEGTPEGQFTKVGGVDSYVATPKGDYPKDKTLLPGRGPTLLWTSTACFRCVRRLVLIFRCFVICDHINNARGREAPEDRGSSMLARIPCVVPSAVVLEAGPHDMPVVQVRH